MLHLFTLYTNLSVHVNILSTNMYVHFVFLEIKIINYKKKSISQWEPALWWTVLRAEWPKYVLT
jgi:hypothetical protein